MSAPDATPGTPAAELAAADDGSGPATGDRPARGAAELAAAVADAVDRLQRRLDATQNPTCAFAVRELQIEAQVELAINEIGVLELGFPRPGERVPAHRMSRIALTIVPMASESSAGRWEPELFDPDLPVGSIAPQHEARLHELQIDTVGDLVRAGAHARTRLRLAAQIPRAGREQIRLWVEQAELATIRGLEPYQARRLVARGVRGIGHLARLAPAAVVERYNREATSPVGREPSQRAAKISLETARCWVAAARRYVPPHVCPADSRPGSASHAALESGGDETAEGQERQ